MDPPLCGLAVNLPGVCSAVQRSTVQRSTVQHSEVCRRDTTCSVNSLLDIFSSVYPVISAGPRNQYLPACQEAARITPQNWQKHRRRSKFCQFGAAGLKEEERCLGDGDGSDS